MQKIDYSQTCNISRTLVGNKIFDHSSPAGAAQLHLHYQLGYNGLGQGNCKTGRETFKFPDRACFILEAWWYTFFLFICLPCKVTQVSRQHYIHCSDIFVGANRATIIETNYILFNTLRPRQNGSHFPHNISKCFFFSWRKMYEFQFDISLKFVSKGAINNIPALVKIMASRRPGDKPLSESMMVWLKAHICVTQPHWVNYMGISWDILYICYTLELTITIKLRVNLQIN